jgi:hypothetical protein
LTVPFASVRANSFTLCPSRFVIRSAAADPWKVRPVRFQIVGALKGAWFSNLTGSDSKRVEPVRFQIVGALKVAWVFEPHRFGFEAGKTCEVRDRSGRNL